MIVLLIEEVANILRCSTRDVQAEIESGKLKAFQVAGQLRVLESELQRFVSGTTTVQSPEPSTEHKGASMSTTATAETALEERLTIQMESMPAFTYVWPDGEPNEYKDPLSVTVQNGGKKAYFIVGKAKSPKKQLGQLRWRFNVFLTSTSRSRQGLISVLDFVGSNAFDRDHLMASLIRHPDGRLVKENDNIPPEYQSFRLAPFNQIVHGPYARSGLAVVADKDDIQTMIRHAVLRSIQKGWLRW